MSYLRRISGDVKSINMFVSLCGLDISPHGISESMNYFYCTLLSYTTTLI